MKKEETHCSKGTFRGSKSVSGSQQGPGGEGTLKKRKISEFIKISFDLLRGP